LIDAIQQRIEGRSDQLMQIAKNYMKTSSSVERAMQYAINKAWSSMPPDEQTKLYSSPIHSDRGVPTVMEFISHYASKIKQDYYVSNKN